MGTGKWARASLGFTSLKDFLPRSLAGVCATGVLSSILRKLPVLLLGERLVRPGQIAVYR